MSSLAVVSPSSTAASTRVGVCQGACAAALPFWPCLGGQLCHPSQQDVRCRAPLGLPQLLPMSHVVPLGLPQLLPMSHVTYSLTGPLALAWPGSHISRGSVWGQSAGFRV